MSDWTTAASRGNASMLRVFGEAMQYLPAGTEPVEITGIWTDERSEAGISGVVWGLESAFAARPRKGDRIVRGGKVYRVAEEPVFETEDGSGGVRLNLRFLEETE